MVIKSLFRIYGTIVECYLEIYNEKVADLLGDNEKLFNGRHRHLKVREHPKKGPYVEGLSQHTVTTDTELLERLESGTNRRRVGSTATNQKSSRSHSVFSVSCDGVKLHLVDLAGNERAGSRGYGPNRFREGANINKSLVALGNVVSTLADQSRSSHSSRNKFVPYRDSVLTWLLKDTLQGNSNTVMIATISPSSNYYSETVNTLRFGQRAKLIVYKPIILEDSKEKTIRELRTEIARLKELLRLSVQIPSTIDTLSLMTTTPKNSSQSLSSSTQDISESSTLTSLSEASKGPLRTTGTTGGSTLNSQEETITTETLLPVMEVKSLVAPKKFTRTYSIDRKYSLETEKSCSSQESLQSPKHKAQPARRLSTTPQPKQTALSLRRLSIHKSNPSLKTITQKRLLGGNKKEKGVGTEAVEHAKKPPEIKTKTKPRAQIVAAVTSRLYSKVNKKDIGTSTENLAVVAKEAPKELSICSNARNRLRDLTHRALKAHRSKNEETQTDLFPVLRVKEIGTDCADLELQQGQVKDASTLHDLEFKDAQVGCTLLNQFIEGTLKNLLVLTKSCGIQTIAEDKPTSSVSFTKYLTGSSPIFSEAVNINISHNYIGGDRNGSFSDDSLENRVPLHTPDLISNHNSLEQHGLDRTVSTESNEPTICHAELGVLDDIYETVHYIPSSQVCASTASTLTAPNYCKHFKTVDVNVAQAPVMFLEEPVWERCQYLPDIYPRALEAKGSICPDIFKKASIKKVQVYRCPDYESLSSESSEDRMSVNLPDSIEYHLANQKKVQFDKKVRKQKNDRMLKAMKDFLEEAKLLMSNISHAAEKSRSSSPKCQQAHLDDFDIQVTVNEISGLGKGSRKSHRRRTRETNSTQTEAPPSMESCHSQTNLDFAEYMVPVNKYEAILEDSCKRLEQHINKQPRSRHVSIASEDFDDDILFERPRYNPWDLSNVEVEDSSLESNPITFSDYGSLPRKTHKRQRTPTCSPSAFLRQLTHMRRQIIESSREELMLQGASGSK
ncbi:uncharacterized protein LOC126735081 isoform X2 [Anthonomus grandis grandis]|uniref:uncharacterized protein LOC126735081 isoform X2 n=1 Tax=Anthonomus grandis grandis TaxID=2921223 RepID=UPI002165C4AA|nr:uncharacterized protein LOC126735081 isoform X2 [Anthonomus grandis grandis]